MSTLNSNISTTYQQKILMRNIIERLSGNSLPGAMLSSNMAIDPRKGAGTMIGDTLTFEAETTGISARSFTKGGNVTFDDTPAISNKQLTVDNFIYTAIKTDEFDANAYDLSYAGNYEIARARELLVKFEQDVITDVLANTNIPTANTISITEYGDGSGNANFTTVNQAVTVLRGNGHTAGSRIFVAVDTNVEGELRLDPRISQANVGGAGGENTLRTGYLSSPVLGAEIHGLLGGGSFDRFPTATTSDGVSGSDEIVGFAISEDAYKLTAINLNQTQVSGAVKMAESVNNIPFTLARYKDFNISSMTHEDLLGFWWGDLVLQPNLIVPITR